MARNSKISFLGRKNPKKVIYLACEGGTTGTEGTYIKQLCDKYNCFYIPIYKGSADPETLANAAIHFSKQGEPKNKKSEIWIVFDNDFPEKVKNAFNKVSEYNKTKKTNYMAVNIAFNAPSIETFGLLCCGITDISQNAATNQSKLKAHMKDYDHSRSAKFDFDVMENGYDNAISRAKDWTNSLAGSPEYFAPQFAGIYKLAESIKN